MITCWATQAHRRYYTVVHLASFSVPPKARRCERRSVALIRTKRTERVRQKLTRLPLGSLVDCS
jgi:hypothetical protein